MINQSALTVTQLNTYIRMLVDSDNLLRKVCVVGEISNFVNHFKTGHCYFSVKDETSAIKAVMFAGNAKSLRFVPENGMRVFITGRVSVFERDGVYQIYAEKMEPEGAGALMIAFEQLKKKLAAEGIFDDDLKKEIPAFPSRIAVITSAVGAALQDIKNVISRRYPLCELILCPVAVQGINCAAENIKAIQTINSLKNADLIIMGRGGGSVEDLWGYNDEQLVRAVAASEIPVITGIGHETDFTLCDFASDLRAPTPSAAAEIAVPDIAELIQINDSLDYRLNKAINNIMFQYEDDVFNISRRLQLLDPRRVLENRTLILSTLNSRLKSAADSSIEKKFLDLTIISEKLRILNPLYFINKGFVPVYKNNERLKSVDKVKEKDLVTVEFADGLLECKVLKIKKAGE